MTNYPQTGTSSTQIADILAHAPVLPVLVIKRLEDAVPLARALVAGGLPVLEITLRTAAALDAIRAIGAAVPEAIVGAGTITRAEHLDAVAHAGARFAVSPGLTGSLARAAALASIPLLPGVATATETMNALDAGFTHLKFFPAQESGGTAMLRALAGPLPAATFCPTGGVTPQNAPEYLALPNVVCVGGTWMAPAALVEARDWNAVTQLAANAAAIKR